VGYNIPDISFRQLKSTNLRNDVYFDFTTFHGVSDFSDVVFSGICDFSDVTFKGGATFLKTNFKDAAYFVGAAFDNVADFTNSKFSEECRFSYCNFAEQSEAFFTEVIFAKIAKFDNSVFAKIDFSSATFNMEAKFGYAKFTNKVFFNRTTFKRVAEFEVTTFQGEATAHFSHAIFKKEAKFGYAKFDNKVFFEHTEFRNGAAFHGAIFQEQAIANFSDAKFSEKSSFIDAKFMADVFFSRAKFTDAIFDGSVFNDGTKVDFSESEFADCTFINCEFKGSTYFDYAYFNTARFNRALFRIETRFFGANFQLRGEFSNCKFADGSVTNFTKCTFRKEALFDNSVFGEIDFSGATFSDQASFTYCKFTNKVFFGDARFIKSAAFDNSVFDDEATVDFSSAIFKEDGTFVSAKFTNKAFFMNTNFGRVNFNQSNFDGGSDFSYASFNEESTFVSAKFSGRTSFMQANFFELANLTGCTFENENDFSKCLFNKKSQFLNCEFTESSVTYFNNASFDQALFDNALFNETYFSGATFSDQASFTYCKFTNKVSFEGTTFKGVAEFVSAIFQDEAVADFSDVTFNQAVKFKGTTLVETFFENTKFNGKADFSYCKFNKKVIFDNKTTFDEKSVTDFSHAEFKDELSFSNITIENITHFDYAVFGDESSVYFINDTRINADIYFTHCRFDNRANFTGCKFLKKTDFTYCRFKQVYFNNGFLTDVNFHGTEFMESDFTDTVLGICDFYLCSFNVARFAHTIFTERADFKFVIFQSGETVLFDVEDISKVSFMNTDISKVRFGDDLYWGRQDRVVDENNLQINERSYVLFKWNDVLINQVVKKRVARFLAALLNLSWIAHDATIWNSTDSNIIKILSTSGNQSISLVLDDNQMSVIVYQNKIEKAYQVLIERNRLPARSFKKEWFVYSKVLKLSAVVSIYRNLAKNYENSLRYEDADKFYRREMEVRRYYREVNSKSVIVVKKNSRLRRNLSLTGLYHLLFDYGLDYLRPIALIIVLALIPVLYALWLGNQTLTPDFSINGVSDVLNVTSSSIASTFGVENQPLEGYIIGVITIPAIIVILVITLKRKFQRKIW